ncbi:hypothetical protein M378DRAFT_733558 [Amanita muscaria Koide BX008]|uniref:F-box domain-containing protein n=1 Tax=Amanita muscaria (strain Koide BX008) TaxID=946122 RepID=A0A0C2SIS7_AMAMK|nr:hypothetical protein M378DRAFT_733558 [Amanita muscaria Koide BX008]
MSDSSSVIDESNRPVQGTEIPALQGPLTTPDDDYPLPAAATISMTLPRELVERILLLLHTRYILACRLVSKEFNEIIQSSTLLQYLLACKAAGVADNPRSPLSYAERLEALEKREDSWRKLKPVYDTTISLNRQKASASHGSIEGVYFVRDDNQKDLNYCHLTSFPQDDPQWIRIPGHGPTVDWTGILVNFVAALNEHDLIVNFISSDIGDQTDMQRHSLDLGLLKISTGEYHPLACRPRIHVQRSPEVEPWIVSKIVGDNLAFVVHSRDGTFSDKLFIFDWKTGRKLLQHDAGENAYSDLDFVSPELLLVPNRVLGHLEVWRLAPQQLNPSPPIQILSLQIPTVSPEYSIFEFRCYAAPNPFLHSMPYLPPRPFFSSPENSIITVTLRMSSNPDGHATSYNLIMHRRALLDTIQTWTSPSLLEQQEYLPTWLTNEVIVYQIADPEDGSVGLDVQSKLVSTMPHPRSSLRDSPTFATSQTSPTFPTSHVSADSGSSSVSSIKSSTSRCTFLQVPWAKWGPRVSRWFQVSDTQARWPVVCNGQRCAFSEPNLLDRRRLRVSVADFNPHNFRRNAEMMARLQSGECDNNGSNGNKGNEEEREEEFEILDHKGVFLEEVYMGLKCVVYRAPDEYDFDLVLMDEERLFGVKLNHHGWEESIKVLHIG